MLLPVLQCSRAPPASAARACHLRHSPRLSNMAHCANRALDPRFPRPAPPAGGSWGRRTSWQYRMTRMSC